MEALLNSQFIQDFIYILMQVVIALTGLILYPFSLIIQALAPDFNTALEKIPDIFSYAMTYMGWIINSFAIPTLVISLTVSIYTFIVLSRFTVWLYKFGLNWYRALK